MIKPIRTYPFLLWFAVAALLVAGFLQVTEEFTGAEEPPELDLWILENLAEFRSPILNVIFINITALGSATLVVLHSVMALALLLTTGDRNGAIQLGVASGGAYGLTEWTKAFIERPRPTTLTALVEATGFSYPSGHALAAAAMYVTIALVACRHLPRARQRTVVTSFTIVIVAAVAFSRVYLGVHYATDVASGILLGTAWALIVAGILAAREYRARRPG